MNAKPKITISPAALEANEPEKPPKAFHEGFLSPHLKPKGKHIMYIIFFQIREVGTNYCISLLWQ